MFEINRYQDVNIPLDTNLNPNSCILKTNETKIQKNEFELDELAFDLNVVKV